MKYCCIIFAPNLICTGPKEVYFLRSWHLLQLRCCVQPVWSAFFIKYLDSLGVESLYSTSRHCPFFDSAIHCEETNWVAQSII